MERKDHREGFNKEEMHKAGEASQGFSNWARKFNKITAIDEKNQKTDPAIIAVRIEGFRELGNLNVLVVAVDFVDLGRWGYPTMRG
jgi:hypothetical protein